jgi:hypothetical protein
MKKSWLFVFIAATLVCGEDFTSCPGGGVCLGQVCQQFKPLGTFCASHAACSSNCCIGMCWTKEACEEVNEQEDRNAGSPPKRPSLPGEESLDARPAA